MVFLVALSLLLLCGVATRAQRHEDLVNSHEVGPPFLREDRKLIFINNEALDIPEEEQAKLWHLYTEKGSLPDIQDLDYGESLVDSASHGDAARRTSHLGEAQVVVAAEEARVTVHDSMGFSDRAIVSQPRPIKSSRFVADPDKEHLIEAVDEEELAGLRPTTSSPTIDERVATEDSSETATVHYEATQVSLLSFLWTELKNIGELLGREMLDTISARFWYLWKSLVKMVQARGRRAIRDQSLEL